MSIIDTAGHSVVTYTGKEKPFSGQRLARFSWKTVTDKSSALYGIKRESKCVSLPVIGASVIEQNIVALIPHISSYLHSVQDKMIREMMETSSISTIRTEDISVTAITEWLESNDESGRLTKESVGNWFNESVAESLAMVLGERLGVSEIPTDAESAKIMAVVSAFKDKIAALAGGKTSYEPKICKSLISALELAPADDVLANRFVGRLNKMISESEAGNALIDML